MFLKLTRTFKACKRSLVTAPCDCLRHARLITLPLPSPLFLQPRDRLRYLVEFYAHLCVCHSLLSIWGT